MRTQTKQILGAYLTLSSLFLVGVLFFLRPIMADEVVGGPLVHPLIGFLISTILYVALFVWVTREMGNPIKAAMAVALAQLVLVDIDFVLSGDRGVATGAASAVLLLVSWSLTGYVYGRLGRQKPNPDK